MTEIPTLRTERLTLRPFTEGDSELLHAILAEPGLLRYYPRPDPPSIEQVRNLIMRELEHWEQHGHGWWAVTLRGMPDLIGWNGLHYLDETDEVEIGYLLSRECWGRGLATEGARAGIAFGFDVLKLEQIVGIVHPENIASRRVLEKLGLNFDREAEYFGMQVCRYTISARKERGAE